MSEVSPMLFEMIMTELSGGRPLAAISREYGVTRSAVYWFRDTSPEYVEAFAKARTLGIDALADECLEIADDSSGDTKRGKFGPTMDAEYVQRSKLRIETRLKLLACYDPKRFGTKIDVRSDDKSMSPAKTLADLYGPDAIP